MKFWGIQRTPDLTDCPDWNTSKFVFRTAQKCKRKEGLVFYSRTVQARKWSRTRNDPQIEPQMTPDRLTVNAEWNGLKFGQLI